VAAAAVPCVPAAPGETVLQVEDLKTYFYTRDGIVRAVDGVSFHVRAGETLALVGESGCGKSVTSLSILRLIASPPGRIVGGRILFRGRDLLSLQEDELRRLRGDGIAMIFQEPMTSLNPVLTIGRQLMEPLMVHRALKGAAARERAGRLLRRVHIAEAERRLDQYPHELSGGMRQRVMIAMALACDPQVLIADEPTTALDVTIQAQILALLAELQSATGAALILITHDLGVVAETADRVAVLYAGRKVEEADVADLFAQPRHPYTRGLMQSLPRLDGTDSGRLHEIPGMVPSLRDPPAGCAFAARCEHASDICGREQPPLQQKSARHSVACWNADRLAGWRR